jgi:glycosyltransferase involved in cell wall biosynthesis
VASSVGMVKEFIKDGVNGYLAGTEEEWVEKISKLIEDPDLRRNIGRMGRKTVEGKFSLKVNAPIFTAVIENLCK